MSMSTVTTRPDFRTPEQVRADEEIVFDHEQFLLIDSTNRWTISGIDDIRRRLAIEGGKEPSNALPGGKIDVPFVWNGKAHKIIRAALRNGIAEVEVAPPDADLKGELLRRIEGNPHHVLTFYQGFGFVCFVEDHARYRDFAPQPG
jgi:hypothetical protein